MPPQVQQLLQNRRLVAIIGAVLALIIVLIISIGMMSGNKKEGNDRKLTEKEQVLATVDSMGRAIEIQALLARENINLIREDVEGGRATLKFEPDATLDQRDRSFVTLVQSGLMDKNVGLEIFDKSDMTASRDDKRIKLVRARNGELARLIRKIEPIQDASVFISMPEPTIFKRDMVPPSATVQVTLGPGERLNRDKVRSIINLLVGSIENLDASRISLTDTNGTVYNSVLNATDEVMDKLEERDRYMEQKVKEQLDRLIGNNKYVVTVSTYLREVPKEEMQLSYAPQDSSLSKSSSFQENLNAQQKGAGGAGGPVSSYVPDDMSSSDNSGERSQRGYNRNGQEMEYNAGKKQVTEEFVPGMMEDITIALTVDGNAFPANMTREEFQTLVARAASPLVKPKNVSIVTGKVEDIAPIAPIQSQSGREIPWWVWALVGGVALIFFLMLMRALSKPGVNPQQLEQQQREIQQLRELANNQVQQIQSAQQQAQQMIQQQQQQLAQITSQNTAALPQQQQQQPASGQVLQQTLSDLQSELKEVLQTTARNDIDEDEMGTQIKSWIEST